MWRHLWKFPSASVKKTKLESDLKIVNFILTEEKRSCPIKVESVLIERDQMGLGENVTLTCRKICNAVIQSNRFQPHPRIVAPSRNFKGQTSNVGLKSLKLKQIQFQFQFQFQ